MADVGKLFHFISHYETPLVLLFETIYAQRREELVIEAPAALKSSSQRDLIGVLQIPAYRQPTGQAGHPKTERLEHASQVGGGRLPLEVGIGRQNNFGDVAIGQAHHQFFDVQVIGANALDRTDSPAKYVIATAEFASLFNSHHIFTLFNNADNGVVTSRIATDATLLFFGHVATGDAETHALFYFAKHIDKATDIDRICLQDEKGNALCALWTHARTTTKLVDEILNYAFIHTHTLLRSTDKRALFLLELPNNLGAQFTSE